MLRFVACVLCVLGADSVQGFRVDSRVVVRVQQRADAAGCLVHLHGNETIARAAMLELAPKTCTNALFIDDAVTGAPWPVERIPVPTTTGECHVNPNRVFTDAGFNARIENDCDNDPVARRALRQFVDDTLLPALNRCRAGDRRLPVVAFHNNSNMTGDDMDARKIDTRDRQSHNILFATADEDYARLASLSRWTVALQNAPAADDGSLSVLLQRERYINVEADISPTNARENVAMGAAAVRSVGADRCGP